MYQKPKGTRDILPKDIAKWQFIEKIIRDTVREFNIKEIRTPIFEDSSLFLRSVGETSDIVTKEMYIFDDRGGRQLALRPEGTAGVVRACVENGLFSNALPLKVWYMGNNFRYENPQAGRYREFTQFGIEYFGTSDPSADCETILVFKSVLDKLRITNYSLQINNIGCPECRKEYNQALRLFANQHENELCEDCKRRSKVNPLRMLDCKKASCQEILKRAPRLEDYLCDSCKSHFNRVISLLKSNGINFDINTQLVRGLDYYTKTVFEFVADIDGKSMAFGGGGRYDNLVGEIGNANIPACGFGMGLDRLVYLVDDALLAKNDLIYIANLGAVGMDKVLPLAQVLRSAGLSVETNISGRTFKSQMKYADKIGARFIVIIGDDEISNGVFTVRNLNTGQECTVDGLNLVKYLKLTDEELKNIIKYADF